MFLKREANELVKGVIHFWSDYRCFSQDLSQLAPLSHHQSSTNQAQDTCNTDLRLNLGSSTP
jgi:hypothetical protein